MKFLLLNQAFHPDVVSTAQHLTDLARALAGAGHEVAVITGRRAYDNPATTFSAHERWKSIEIRRVRGTSFGKKAKWRRGCDFITFIAACVVRLLFAPRPDVVVALTSPPLISFIGALFARLRRCKFVYWVMDLNPDEAIAAGFLQPESGAARVFERMSLFSFQNAAKAIVLDRFMLDRVSRKGIAADRLAVLPPWSHDDAVRFDAAAREEFRREHNLTGKFVVMYSGNHSPCHPLTTLLEAARTLASNDRFAFCFIGGGSEFAKVQQFAATHRLKNIMCLPYQPLGKLAGSLSAADLHVVVMGNPFVGTIHPCKVYNILSVEAPLLYFGPEESHIADILREMNSPKAVRVAHEDVMGAVNAIQAIAARGGRAEPAQYRKMAERFSQQRLVPEMVAALESTAGSSAARALVSESKSSPLSVES